MKKTIMAMTLAVWSTLVLCPMTTAAAGERAPSAAQLSLPGEIVSEVAFGAASAPQKENRLIHPALLSLQGEVVERVLAPAPALRAAPEPAFACLR